MEGKQENIKITEEFVFFYRIVLRALEFFQGKLYR